MYISCHCVNAPFLGIQTYISNSIDNGAILLFNTHHFLLKIRPFCETHDLDWSQAQADFLVYHLFKMIKPMTAPQISSR